MRDFPGNFRDNLRVTCRTLLVAALAVGALIVILVIVYTAFDLGAVLPERRR